MLSNILSGLALLVACQALPVDKQAPQAVVAQKSYTGVETADGTIGYLPVNSGWAAFDFGDVNSTTTIAMNLFCSGRLNLTDLFCSGDRFEIFDNGVCLGKTSRPCYNNCKSNTTCPDYAQSHEEWSSASYYLSAGFHNITIKVLEAPYCYGNGAIRVDTYYGHGHRYYSDSEPEKAELGVGKGYGYRRRQHHHHCNVQRCNVEKGDLVFVHTEVPRCQAEEVCQSMGLHLANINITNFMEATELAFNCGGALSQTWIDDWNGDKYSGSCLVLSTGNQAPGGAINVPNCCSSKLPVMCQKAPCYHPRVHYDCNECRRSCHCDRRHGHHGCHECVGGKCTESARCPLLG